MPKLVALQHSPIIETIMIRLAEASVDATCVEEPTVGELYVGGVPSVAIWIADREDMERATEILNTVHAELPQSSSTKCPHCSYDMRGHEGRTACPECGLDLSAPIADVACAHCGAEVPGHFDVCWSCGGSVGPDGPDVEG